MLESMKSIWKTTWNFPSEFLAQKSTRNDIATTEGKSEDQEGSGDSSLFSALEPPSFCKIK